ncbi:hypothetical protein K7X08_003911 [Anisodus acutangulus]|uniref:Kinetochore protein SPC25 n=1 Tax=Anisodus acutangulus TaxID=402998 RepID=A0A9Q1MGK5_9SOLA|nr:hypothetical protein K7X08_003911 [Anisodus acutangulus]
MLKLRGVVEDEYSALLSLQADALKALEEKLNQNTEDRDAIQEATVWYNKVLGLRIECGQDANNPDDEYSFTVRHENDVHTLIDCDPQLNDAKELLIELNKSNGLFKFVRTMREISRSCSTWINITRERSDVLSPVSASSFRRSHRFKVKK